MKYPPLAPVTLRDSPVPARVSVAPMMDWTDRHCRYFFRLLTQDTRLYTEMVTAQAILQGDRNRLLRYDASEHPLALQLGGSDPDELAAATQIASEYGYDEININIGCPSDRVQSGRFGACLMAEPDRVAACVHAMRAVSGVPVTVKTRIGIDDLDHYEFLLDFVDRVAAAGCRYFIVHARKAILAGLSPKENRSIPPLKYDTVYRLKQDRPELIIVLNGGVESSDAVQAHLEHVDGVMIGRKAYADPYFLTELQANVLRHAGGQQRGHARTAPPSREALIRQMADYAERELGAGTRLHHITRHLLGLYNGLPSARRWRRFISEQASKPGADPQVLIDSLSIFDVAA